MELVFDFRYERAGDPGRLRLEQAEPLLACYQQVLGHDLPNRLVALQGLAVLLDRPASDSSPLDEETSQLLRQVADRARGIDGWIRHVAAVGRLAREASAGGSSSVDEVIPEAAAEAKMLFPGLAVDYHWQEGLPAVRAPRASLHQVLMLLLRKAAAGVPSGESTHATIAARNAAHGVEIEIADTRPPWVISGRLDLLKDLFAPDRATEEPRLGLLLVRQLVAGWEGVLRVRCEAEVGNSVTLVLPSA